MSRRKCKVCGKSCFPDRVSALLQIATFQSRSTRDKAPQRVYWSKACGTHHLTSRP